jgi:hypothetical protein
MPDADLSERPGPAVYGAEAVPGPAAESPTSGSSRRIPVRDIPFIVLTGAILVIPFGIILQGAFSALGLTNAVGDLSFDVWVFAGGAAAFLIHRRLRVNGIPLAFGCGAVVGWTIMMMLAVSFGWAGMALVGVASAVIGIRITRPRQRHPA